MLVPVPFPWAGFKITIETTQLVIRRATNQQAIQFHSAKLLPNGQGQL
jgi:hypothetical protein